MPAAKLRHRGLGALTILTIVGAIIPGLAIAYLSTRIGETPLVVQPTPIAEETFVVTREIVEEWVVEVVITRGPAVSLVAGARSGEGVVTRLLLDVGDTIQNGRPVYSVDGVDVLAALTPEPFHRVLTIGASGRDVRMLQEWLTQLGYLGSEEVTGSFGAATSRAVSEMHRDRGIIGTTRSFSPSDVLWLPEERLVVSEIRVAAGSPAPGHGAVILVSVRPFDSAKVRLPNGNPIDLPGTWDLIVGDEIAGTVADGVVSPDAIETLVELGAPNADAPGAQGTEPDSVSVTAIARSQARLHRNVVPVGTVLSFPGFENASQDRACIYVRDGDAYVPYPTSIVGGDFGVLYIEPAPPLLVTILANPIQALPNPLCE